MIGEKNAEFAVRGIMLDPARLTERHEFYDDLLPLLSRWGYNTLWWHFCDDEGMALELESYPELASPYAFSKDQTSEFIKKASELGIDVVPEVETLGHSLWITGHERFKHLFDGLPYGHNAICPSHPETMDVLRPIIEEVSELFPSRFFHAGLDEAVFAGCPRCSQRSAGRPDWWVFAQHVKTVYETVKSLGKTMVMWADGMEKHPELLDILPRDIVMAHWHYKDIPEEKIWPSAAAGFRVICVPAIQTMIQPAPENFQNTNGMIDLAARIPRDKCLGVVNTFWESFRVLRDTVFPVIAVCGKALKDARTADWPIETADFIDDFFGISHQQAAETFWESLSMTISREEFLFLYADSAADVVKTLRFADEAGFDERLSKSLDNHEKLQFMREKVKKNREIFEAHILASRISVVALQSASRWRDAFAHYCCAEQASGYAGPEAADVVEHLEKTLSLLTAIRDDVAEITDAVSREWDRTRYVNDLKKDNSSPSMRQRSRKTLLANMIRSKRYFEKIVDRLESGMAEFVAGGPFPGGL